MTEVEKIRAMAAADLRAEAQADDRGGMPFTAAVLRECADEIERRHAGAERVLRAVYVWCAMAAARRMAIERAFALALRNGDLHEGCAACDQRIADAIAASLSPGTDKVE